ncbi:MAG: hypothetical protein CL840_02625 [Crocinitomicaceae bacterium]|nr:hypothetical protein [Crocinitomicaceae bacterium]|tara:strand:+ start:9944 stop:10708 length:765 start_codon:yes stop_codon:yes gene_type:complete
MNEESLKIAKKIERLKMEFSMLPPITERNSSIEIEEYQHYLLELEELLIVFKYLQENNIQQKVTNKQEASPIESKEEITNPVEEPVNVDQVEDQHVETESLEEELVEVDNETLDAEVAEQIDDEVASETLNQTEPSEEEQIVEKSKPLTEFVETGSSLNDQLEANDDSLANKLSKQPISDLRTAFGLNERFLFANELFGGDGQEFIRALNEFNHLDNFEDAKRLIKARYESDFGWKPDDENVMAFVGVVERRYL